MRKNVIVVGLCCICSVLLVGCKVGFWNKDTVIKEEVLTTESALPEKPPTPQKEETLQFDAQWEDPSTEEEFSDEQKAEWMEREQDYYCFSVLPVTEQNVYVEILYALVNQIENMELSTLDTQTIEKVFQCVLNDHPEIFYAEGYNFTKYSRGDQIEKITFTGAFTYSPEEITSRKRTLEGYIANYQSNIPVGGSDYDKIKAVFEQIVFETEYDLNSSDNQNIYSVFVNKRSVCQGYAKAVQLLLQRIGIQSCLVTGYVETGERHAWNLVRADGEYYYLDATWGDAFYLFDGQNYENMPITGETINYDYLLVPSKQIGITHKDTMMIPLPVCNSLEDNYYVRENMYFEELNTEQLEQLLDRAKEQGRNMVTIKCANEAVFTQMYGYLIEEQKIFDFIKNSAGNLYYTQSQRMNSITFWLP